MNRFRVSRRHLLRGAGGVALALPFIEAMAPVKKASAAGPAKRFVIVYSANGTNDPGQFTAKGTAGQFEFGKELAPLAAHKQNLLMLTGVNVQSAMGIGQDQGDLHGVGMAHMLTSTKMVRADGFRSVAGLPNVLAGGPSIDQEIARRLAGSTRFPSLELAVQSTTLLGAHPFTRMSYKDKAMPVPAEENPTAAFNRLFSDGSVGGAAEGSATAAAAQAERRSVLDFVMDDYSRLAPKLGKSDQAKLEAHLGAVRALEKRVSSATAGVSCKRAAAPMPLPHTDPKNYPEIGKQQMDVLTLALACDLTRVAGLQWSYARSNITLPWATGGNDNHHDMSHGGAGAKLTAINAWYATQVAYLASAMKAVSEGERSLLDNSVILWCSEVAMGPSHSFAGVRAVLLGSCGGAIKTGQSLSLNGASHGRLFVTLMNAMGIDAKEFGDPKFGVGPVSGVLA